MIQKTASGLMGLLFFGAFGAAAQPPPCLSEGPPRVLHEAAKLLAGDGSNLDRLGGSASIEQDTLVAGAANGGEHKDGVAYVFTRSGGEWTEAQTLSGGAENFGTAVALRDGVIVVGTGHNFGSNATAYIFERPQGGIWHEVAAFSIEEDLYEWFGFAVAIGGPRRVLVGAPKDWSLGYRIGAVYDFVKDLTSGEWNASAKVEPSDPFPWSNFGWSLALEEPVAVVGAFDLTSTGWGAARVFLREPPGDALQEVALLEPDPLQNFTRFGSAVATSGATIVVGAPREGRGTVYVFRRVGPYDWVQVARLRPCDQGSQYSRFGASIALEDDRLVVGAPEHDGNKGAAYVYERDSSTARWKLKALLEASDRQTQSYLGTSVGLSGTTVIAGAPKDSELGQWSGALYVFELPRLSGSGWGGPKSDR